MGTIIASAEIPAPVDAVWGYCKDITNTPRWFPAIPSVRAVSERAEGVGAEYEFTARNAGRVVTYRMRVTEWEEGRRVRQEIVPASGSGLWSSLLESMSVLWQYEPVDGRARLSVVQEMRLKGLADLLTQPWLLVFDRQLYRRAFRRLADIMMQRMQEPAPA